MAIALVMIMFLIMVMIIYVIVMMIFFFLWYIYFICPQASSKLVQEYFGKNGSNIVDLPVTVIFRLQNN